MGIVTRYADSARDPSVTPAPVIPSAITNGRGRALIGTVEVANGDSPTSTVNFGSLPSSARLRPSGKIFYDALTGVTSFSLGDANYPNALVNAADIHLAGSASALSAVDIASYTQPLWKVLGYAADPGGSISIIGTLNQAATAAGTITLDLPWALD